MLQLVNVGHKSLADYATIATRGLMDEIRALAEPLAGARVLELSATAFGGGVAEIQYTLVPLMQDAGLEVEWRIIRGADEFFAATKTIHNALQGNPQGLTDEQRACFTRFQELNAREIEIEEYDFVFVHDPQPVGVIDYLGGGRAKWAWRGHIDFSTPNPDVLDFLLPSIRRYDAAVFHLAEYVPKREGLPPCVIWPPAIDPLAPKNMALSAEDAAYVVDQFGIDVSRPLLTQVSRFDPWKDPLGVIDAYRLVKEEVAGVQLALVGSMAHDDPEGWEFWNQTVAYADGDPDIFILSNLNNVGAIEVNAFQVHSAAVDSEVDQGRLRADCLRRAVEVAADGRGKRGRDPHADRERTHRLARRLGGGMRRRMPRGSRRSRARHGSALFSAKSTCASGSSRRGCFATGLRSSTGSSGARPAPTSR